MYNKLFYILLFLPLLLSTTSQHLSPKQEINKEKGNQYSLNIVAMVNDYTLVNKVSDPLLNDNQYLNRFSLQEFKEREIRDKEMKNRENEILKNTLNKWASYFGKKFEQVLLDPFEVRVQNNVDSLNRLIINVSDGLLNMCNKMVAKTTSSLPLSYSSYAQFETEMRSTINNEGSKSDRDTESSGFFSIFSSSSQSKEVVLSKDISKAELTKAELEAEVLQQMYDYQLYRLALNNRQTFLNGLCFNTFGLPYTLYYNSVNNTLSSEFNTHTLNYYTIVVQNIIDNGFIRNLNRGFKSQTKNNGNDKKTDFNFDVEFDIDKDKKEILVEKAKYILPILQRMEQRLPNYLSDIAKRSLNIDEYFQNLRQFWTEILDETIIAAHDSPLKYKFELAALRLKAEDELKMRLKAEQESAERVLKSQQIEKEKMQRAEQEAQRIKDEYKKKALIDEARDFVRQAEILFKERQQNFSNQEWQQFNVWFSHQMTKGVDVYDSVLGGLGQVLHSTFSIPTNVIVNFASTQVSEIGKLLILVAGVVIVGLMTLFFVKLFIRRFIRLFWNLGEEKK
jgi:hypothetical protein